jgi:hypothetical protein
VTRAGSGFSGSFVGGFPTARLGFTLRRGHKGTEHLSTKGTGAPLLEVVLFVYWSSIIWRRSGSRLGPGSGRRLVLDKVTLYTI